MIDLIGDIHGFADKLEELLEKLGYSKTNNYYSHPTRKVLFVGDYIDRGEKIKETLEIVRQMVAHGSAIALMGNHEYNALCFNFQETSGGHLRKHLIKNILQHYETLHQFKNMQAEYEEHLEWFKTLPLFYETENFRAVPACWDNKNINFLKQKLVKNCLTDDLIYESVKKETRLHATLEETLKGREMRMPQGLFFYDKDGFKRKDIRIKWWEDPAVMNYKTISVEPLDNLPETPVDLSAFAEHGYYTASEKPVFFGHYWLKGEPMLYKQNICCLDYSVAKKGYLVAYRYDGEEKLDGTKLVFV